MNRINSIIAQIIILLGLFYLYMGENYLVDDTVIVFTIILVLISFLLRSMIKKKNRLLNKNPFTLTSLFSLSFFITLFQIPIDYLFATERMRFNRFFHDLFLMNKSIVFSAICLVCFNIGYSLVLEKNSDNKLRDAETSKNLKIKTLPFFIIVLFLFVLHMLTVNKGYYLGRAEVLTGFPKTAHDYLSRFIVIVILISVWNLKLTSYGTKTGVLKYLRSFPKFFIPFLIVFSMLTISAADRGPVVRIILCLTFGYFIVNFSKIKFIVFIAAVIGTGYFFSVAKLVGGYTGKGSYTEGFSEAQDRFENSQKAKSFSPYTVELAGSIYSNNVLFSLWYSGHSMYGTGLLTGVLMAVPAGVSTFSKITGLSGPMISSAHLATVSEGTIAGLGTTVVADALINTGFLGALVFLFLLGGIFKRADINLYSKTPSFKWFLLGYILIAECIIMPRASMFPSIGTFLFDYAAIYLILVFFDRKPIKFLFKKN